MRKILLSVLAAPVLVHAVPAMAREDSVAVSYADLDLSDPADFARLEDRLAAAAKKVCTANWSTTLSRWTNAKTCEADTLEKALAEAEALLAPEPSAPLALAD